MTITPTLATPLRAPSTPAAPPKPPNPPAGDATLREAFDAFVGETFFSQMLKAMRKTVGKPAYLHGGRAEEIFTAQLDQVLAEKMGQASAEKLTGPMFELFMTQRRGK